MQELRKTGISVFGDIPWGSHVCNFYDTKEDLLDILVPYFKAGLENKEYCLWVVSSPEMLTVEDAKAALEQAVPDFDRHLVDRNIEFISALDWYLQNNKFNLERVTSAWSEKLKRALARGYDGMRVSGDTFWLREKDWTDFFTYEKQLNDYITDLPITLLCTYPLAESGATEVLDVVQAHQYAVARRKGEWEVIETPELIQAQSEIKKLNKELEQRVAERTRQLETAVEKLREDITERKNSEHELSLAYQRLSYHFENTPLAVIELDKDLFITRWSKRAEEIFGWKASEALGKNVYDPDFPIIYEDDLEAVVKINEQLMKGIVNRNLSLNRNYTKEGNVIDNEWYNSVLRDEKGNVITILSLVHNVTERKKVEAELANQQMLQQKLIMETSILGQERERETIGKELHDNINQILVATKLYLEHAIQAAPDMRTELLQRSFSNITFAIEQIRQFSASLIAPSLGEVTLVEAINVLVDTIRSTSSLMFEFNNSHYSGKSIDNGIQLMLYRIVQEQTNNILKHANAKHVVIDLSNTSTQITMTIKDDGVGFDTKKTSKGIGLRNMANRAEFYNGKIKIISSTGKGCKLEVTIPLIETKQTK